jgi:hypothetical protein
MNVTLFQKFYNKECIFWTKDEIESVDLHVKENQDRYFTINDVHYRWKYVSDYNLFDFKFELEDGINLIVIHEDINQQELKNFVTNFQSENKVVYIVLTKLIEDYWGINSIREDVDFFKKISKNNSVKIIWDIPFQKLDNFIFSPKVQIQSYFLNRMVNCEAYYLGRDLFVQTPKNYRIGFHINKISGKLRLELVEKLKNYKNKNLFHTVNVDCGFNKKFGFEGYGNYKSKTYTSQIENEYGTGVTQFWYQLQFFELGIKSQMEIVYETFTYVSNNKPKETWLIKWNEKTIKHLYLGKPFIHCDPVAHKLMYENEMKPYKPLYTDELWNIYENWDINTINEWGFIEKVIENIEWLCNMDDTEWNWRIGEAMKIAEWNKSKVDQLIFDTSLMDIVKSDIY